MKIEINKHYIDADGDVIYIAKHMPNEQCCFIDNEGHSYTKNGYYLLHNNLSICDLICECNTDILNKYMDKDITQKEFIQQHIDYYTKGKK